MPTSNRISSTTAIDIPRQSNRRLKPLPPPQTIPSSSQDHPQKPVNSANSLITWQQTQLIKNTDIPQQAQQSPFSNYALRAIVTYRHHANWEKLEVLQQMIGIDEYA